MSAKIYSGISHCPHTEMDASHPLLECENLLVCQGVGFCDDRNEIDLGVKTLHHLNVQRFERMTSGLDKIDACVYPVVDDSGSVDLAFRIKIGIKAIVDIINDCTPRLIIVDEFPKPWSIDDR